MWHFQFESAWRSICRFPVLSALIVVAIALGLAATMSTATIVWRLGADPIPTKSRQLFYVMLDAWDTNGYSEALNAPDQLTYPDSMALLRSRPDVKQAAMYRVALALQPDTLELAPKIVDGRATTRHFLPMFEYQMLEGSTWTESDDRDGTAVAVIAESLRRTLFGDQPGLGKELVLSNKRYKIIGVYQEPKRVIRVHDVTNGAIMKSEDFFFPIQTAVRLELETSGNTNCWKGYEGGFKGKQLSECVWLQHWVELSDQSAVADFQRHIDSYAAQQKALGRFPRTAENNVLADVLTHMQLQRVVSDDQRMASWVGIGFLLVAIINATCLLLAKFLRGSHTAAVHRSLGAGRADVFRLHLIEAFVIGLMSAGLGVLFTWLAMLGMRWAQADLQEIAVLDVRLISILVAISLTASLLAAIVPAWRVSRLPPAASLRMN